VHVDSRRHCSDIATHSSRRAPNGEETKEGGGEEEDQAQEEAVTSLMIFGL